MEENQFPDYYKTLGVESNANLAELKHSYHQLSLKYHPDKTQDKDTEEFIKVKLAFKILSDANLKQHYDEQYVAFTNNKLVAVHDRLSLQELTLNGDVYESSCRCGGSFVLVKEATELSLTSLYVSCDTCSLCISVDLI